MLLAVGFHLSRIHRHLPRQFGLTTNLFPFSKDVAQQWTIHVTTIKVLRIPLLVCLEISRLALGILSCRHFRHRFSLRLKRLSAVGFLDIGQQHLSRGSVADDVVDVLQQVVMLAILQQSEPEQPVAHDVEWLYELRHLCLNVGAT